MQKSINFSQYDPIYDISGNVVFANNGNIVCCYHLDLPEIYSLSERNFEELHGIWFQALKALPIGTVVHKQDHFLKRRYTGRDLPRDTYLAKATHDHFKGREHMAHSSYLFLTWPKNRALNNPSLVNPFRSASNAVVGEMDQKAQQFVSAVNDAVNYINNSKRIEAAPMGAGAIEALKLSYFNGQQDEFSTDTLLGRSITSGDSFFDVLAINNEQCFGGEVGTSITNEDFTTDDFTFHKGFVDGLGLSLGENHIVNSIMYLDDRQKWIRYLDKKVEELNKSINFGSQNRVVLGKIEDILGQINADDGSRVVRGHFNIVYWGEGPEDLKRIQSLINAELKALDIFPYYPKAEVKKNYFLNSFFCYASNFSNEDLYVTDIKHGLCLMINNTNYKSDPEGIAFVDRQFNVPVVKDVWDRRKKRIKARNFAIFAPTGEGKSFLANNILRQFYEQGVRLVIIDLGGSYSKFAKLYPNDHVVLKYEEGKSLGINPFYVPKGDRALTDRIEDIATFLFQLYPAKEVGKSMEVVLKKILLEYYQQVDQGHSLPGFYAFLRGNRAEIFGRLEVSDRFFDVDDFLLILSEYVGDGLYSFLFKDTEDQSFRFEDKHIIIFELDEVKDNKEILAVMLKLIKSAIQRTIWRNRDERGIILFDEFAKQLKFDGVLSSVEYYYQAIRKYEGAIGIVLQSINQLPKTSTAASMLENTQVIYALNNEKGYQELVERLKLGSHDLNQLNSIRSNLKGERRYTELFMKVGKESNIFRLEVPPKVFAAYLTDGETNTRLMELYEKMGSMEAAIEEFTADKRTNIKP